ncbi:MAG: type II toxin-antitoxin system VapC family toxin [Deltaproteobacteria bacterium]|nr:type II toxin-antitoxin system VapC family toxin [Deltaproteobacteria bacterium]
MNYIVDTHILIWSFTDPDKLSQNVQITLLDENNSIFYSQYSLWEISLKYSLKKLQLLGKTPEEFYRAIDDSFFICKQIDNLELVTFYKLPIEHKDPFDRAIIWQAIVNDLILISVDNKLDSYKQHGLKCL